MVPVIFAVFGAGLFFKLGQAIADEEYQGSDVPEHVREKKLREHVNSYDYLCPRCGKRRFDLEIDHIIPIASGGRNSWYNLQILCGDCNRRKATRYTWWEAFRGRAK